MAILRVASLLAVLATTATGNMPSPRAFAASTRGGSSEGDNPDALYVDLTVQFEGQKSESEGDTPILPADEMPRVVAPTEAADPSPSVESSTVASAPSIPTMLVLKKFLEGWPSTVGAHSVDYARRIAPSLFVALTLKYGWHRPLQVFLGALTPFFYQRFHAGKNSDSKILVWSLFAAYSMLANPLVAVSPQTTMVGAGLGLATTIYSLVQLHLQQTPGYFECQQTCRQWIQSHVALSITLLPAWAWARSLRDVPVQWNAAAVGLVAWNDLAQFMGRRIVGKPPMGVLPMSKEEILSWVVPALLTLAATPVTGLPLKEGILLALLIAIGAPTARTALQVVNWARGSQDAERLGVLDPGLLDTQWLLAPLLYAFFNCAKLNL